MKREILSYRMLPIWRGFELLYFALEFLLCLDLQSNGLFNRNSKSRNYEVVEFFQEVFLALFAGHRSSGLFDFCIRSFLGTIG